MNRQAIFGATMWLACLAAAQAGAVDLGVIEVLFLLAPLVIVPLALQVAMTIAPQLRQAGGRLLEHFQPLAAVCAAAAFFFGTRGTAAGLAGVWLLFCAVVAVVALLFLWKARPRTLPEWCVAVGMIHLPVGGVGLCLSRAGIAPIGIEEPIVLLTAVHFHYTAFAAPVLAAAVGAAKAANHRGSLYVLSVIGLLAGTPLLGMGFALWLPGVKLAAVMMIVAGVTGLAVLTLMSLREVARSARVYLGISALAVLAGMALAAAYGAGEFMGESYVSLADMGRYHGIANGIGFTLCGLLGWRIALAGRFSQEVRNVAGD